LSCGTRCGFEKWRERKARKKPCERLEGGVSSERGSEHPERRTWTHRALVACVPLVVLARLVTPVRRGEPGLAPEPVGDALDDAAGDGPLAVVLEGVHEFVREDALDLVPDALAVAVCAGGDALEVREREVELLVVVVEVRTAGVGDAVEGV